MRDVVIETQDYRLEVLTEEEQEKYNTNYAVVNKIYAVTEAMCPVLSTGYEIIEELQEMLTNAKKNNQKAAMKVVH